MRSWLAILSFFGEHLKAHALAFMLSLPEAGPTFTVQSMLQRRGKLRRLASGTSILTESQ